MHDFDTICVISSAIGEAGIGVIRLSGPQAYPVLQRIFKPRKPVDSFSPRRLYLGHIVNPETTQVVDEAFAVFMRKPFTYTREDMAEVFSHGGISPQRQIISLMIREGARVAEPGEFTKRAFLNGRIDLAQAESVLDIIQSESDEEARSALQHLSGALTQKLGSIKESVKRGLANVEALIDFPEEEIEIDREETAALLEQARHSLDGLVASYTEGRAIKKGLDILIVGRTNVGKSSLLNALLMEEKAIVTPLPGTTRDLIEDVLHVKGIKLRITDTAGLRHPKDIVEREGIERVRKRIPEADVILWVVDHADDYTDEDEEIYRTIRTKKIVVAINKSDLARKLPRDRLAEKNLPLMDVSALTGAGLDELKLALYGAAMGKKRKSPALLITNLRHRDALTKARETVKRAIALYRSAEPAELVAFELRDALSRIGEVTGETCTDDILNDIFSRFCIGK